MVPVDRKGILRLQTRDPTPGHLDSCGEEQQRSVAEMFLLQELCTTGSWVASTDESKGESYAVIKRDQTSPIC